MRQETHGLLGGFPLLISNNYSCKLLFFQWKLCPQLCQQDFWADYCFPGNRQEAPSLLESVGNPPGLVEHTGSQPYPKTQS